MQTKTAAPLKPKAKPAPAPAPEDETFMRLFCAALTGMCSQIEYRLPDPDWYKSDNFPDTDWELREREQYLVDRAYRLAQYARNRLQDLAEVTQFSDSL